MSEENIYNILRSGGLSAAGACGVMGNMDAESGMVSFRVQGDSKPPYDFSRNYTDNVDAGNITEHDFIYNGPNGGGYGLCQWTYFTRKAELYGFAKEKGVSVGDETMQCLFTLHELKKYYADLYQFLCTTDDLAEAAKKVCSQYERPAVNNFAYRINAAQKYYNLFGSNTHIDCTEDACPIPDLEDTQLLLSVDVRMLGKGDLGRDVFLLQAGLSDMGYDCGFPDGDFGKLTEDAVKELQHDHQLSCSGVADIPTWNIILKPR